MSRINANDVNEHLKNYKELIIAKNITSTRIWTWLKIVLIAMYLKNI